MVERLYSVDIWTNDEATTLYLKDVRQANFVADTGVFYAVMSDGTMYMAPKETIHHVWIKPQNNN